MNHTPNPFDDHENTARDNDRAIPTTSHLIPAPRIPSDPIERFPRQPRPEER